MFSSLTVLFCLSLYVMFLLMVGLWVERKAAVGANLADNPYVYSLSLAVYCTAWTYYGSVGKAATSGMLFLTIYIGPMLCAVLWWQVVRRMVRVKRKLHITSIADFLAARYDKSPAIAALASLCALVGTVPYISLQLKSVIETFEMVSMPGGGLSSVVHANMGPILVTLVIVFVILFGVRRVDPTERHQGMMVVVAVESVIKLAALLAVGMFVTYYLFDGFEDIFTALEGTDYFKPMGESGSGIRYSTWASYLILAMAAILFLPRQFHVMVVENSREKHILTAMWLFPLYLIAINLFVLPISMGGLLLGLPKIKADFFVLQIPMAAGRHALALFAFIGGFSASMSMVMIAAMTMAVMISNNLIMPLLGMVKGLEPLRRRVLVIRWVVVAGYVVVGYWFYRLVGEGSMLVNIGIISFAAVLQFAPCTLGGVFWPRAGKAGAFLGMVSGFAVWFYTLIIPALARGNIIDVYILGRGPFGIRALKPEALLGVSDLDPISNSVFFSLLVNTAFFIVGSLVFERKDSERRTAREFTASMAGEARREPHRHETECRIIPLQEKIPDFQALLGQYLTHSRAEDVLAECLRSAGLKGRATVSILQLAELHGNVEKRLAGVIGSAAANRAMIASGIITEGEETELAEAYSGLLAEMRLSPEELKQRIDYYKDRESLLTMHAEELKARIHERDKEISKRKRIESALRQARKKYRDIFENAVEGIYQCTPEGRFLAVNSSMARILGYASPREIIGAVGDIAEELLMVAEDWVRFRFLIMRIESVVSFEVRMRRKDGEVIWVSLSGRSVKDETGNLAYVEGSMQDVTERRRAQEEVFKLNAELEARVVERTAELEAANKELEAFSYSVSHDLRAPLRSIDGFSQVLLEDYADTLDSEGRHCLARVRNATQRMGELIDDLLHLTGVTRSEMRREMVDLSSLFKEIADHDLAGEPERRVEVVVEPGLETKADPKLVRVMFANLVNNSLKFTSRKPDARIEFGAEEQAGHKVFFIRDNGAGFDAKYAHKMFGPFNRLHSPDEFEGTGIGLAIVERVVQRHGGVIWAEGEEDKGAVFRFTLETKGEMAYGVGRNR